jgi:hypothetical protein
MPPSGEYEYIVQACCSLSYYPEFCMLRAETARTLGDWIYEDILCRWGSLHEIVTDNGPAFLKVMDQSLWDMTKKGTLTGVLTFSVLRPPKCDVCILGK